MSLMKSPCLDCEKRIVTDDVNCHSVCEQYLSFRADLDEINRRERDISDKALYEIESIRRIKRKTHRR